MSGDQPPRSDERQAARELLMVNLLSAVYWFDDALQAGLEARGWPKVTRVQSLILANIAAGVNRGAQLARNLGVTRQAMSQTLADMEARGLVVTRQDPDDKRARLVGFSERSAPIRDDAVATLQVIEATLGSRIGTRQLDAFKDVAAADWGPSPVAIVAVAAGAPARERKPRGRPRKAPAAT